MGLCKVRVSHIRRAASRLMQWATSPYPVDHAIELTAINIDGEFVNVDEKTKKRVFDLVPQTPEEIAADKKLAIAASAREQARAALEAVQAEDQPTQVADEPPTHPAEKETDAVASEGAEETETAEASEGAEEAEAAETSEATAADEPPPPE